MRTIARARRLVFPKAMSPRFRVLIVVTVLSACGSGPNAPTAAATVTITAAGVSPKEVRIKAWNYVTFVNMDNRSHAIASDPVDLHTQCPPLNRVGVLLPGESRDTGTLNLAGNCGFHDHNNTSDATLQGRIIVE
jgi:plastocyanin